ncbi:MAG: PQQ-dependent sugar dehydrogenase [Bryobacteraceae bacterium]
MRRTAGGVSWLLALFLLDAVFHLQLYAQPAGEWPVIRVIPVLRGLSSPVDIAHAGDGSGRLFILEQRGRIRIARNGVIQETPFLDISQRVVAGGERGLLGVAFPPDFRAKRYFYVNYTTVARDGRRLGDTVIARYSLTANDDIADPASETVFLTVPQPFSNHNGGQIVFGPRDGLLYIGMGDGGSGGDPDNRAQNPQELLGKMLRLDVEAGSREPRIWALGLRNPWRFSFDRQTADLYIADVGQNAREEVNFQPAASAGGENYGWNIMEARNCFPTSANCNQQGLVLPVADYGRNDGCSVTGGFVYRGSRYPALGGIYFFADYCTGKIWGMRRQGDEWSNRILLNSGLPISTFGEDEEGEIYLTAHERLGEIYQLAGAAPSFSSGGIVNAASFTPDISPGSLATVFGLGLSTVSGILTAPAVPLPASLAGTSVTVNGVPAPVIAIAFVNGLEQINFQVPYEAAGPASARVVVTNNGATSAADATVRAFHPGVFTLEGTQAVVLHANFQLITSSSPAVPDETIILYATGMGPVSPQPPTGQTVATEPFARTTTTPAITVGGISATVPFSGLAPEFPGVYQLNVRVPANLAAGSQEVVVSIGGASSPPVRIPVGTPR